ncbi:DDE-type integrase/transposase/recombinase [Listeria monocytogenes]|nr:DDE-type integrase/transposase/recombinase [Listeria monocytogenes]EJZ9084347.1 DDE-type integrase/transposase/recombinase [Listeria monocytogenes]
MSTVKPRFRYQKPTVSSTCPNLLKQQFHSKQPNRIWVSDISYIPVKKGFVYLCVILDIFSRKVIAWNVYASMTAKLVCDTVERAVHSRNPVQSVIFTLIVVPNICLKNYGRSKKNTTLSLPILNLLTRGIMPSQNLSLNT